MNRALIDGLRIACLLLVLPALLFAQEHGLSKNEPIDTRMFGEMNAPPGFRANAGQGIDAPPSGTALDAPLTKRAWRYRDEDALPYCLELTADTWVTLFSETFTTGAGTEYIELVYSGQFTCSTGTSPFSGVLIRASVTQGATTEFFPGAGDDGPPWITRRDNDGNGQQTFCEFQGLLLVDSSSSTTVTIELKASNDLGYACFNNITINYD